MTKEELVKKQLVDHSKEVFKQHGYAAVTMDHIAKASGKGRSTLYYYFKNKHDVFEAFVTAEYTDMITTAAASVSPHQTITDNLYKYTESKLTSLIHKTETYTLLLSDIKHNEDILNKTLVKIRDKDIALVKQCLHWAMEKKEIKPISEDDIDFLALALVTATGSLEKEIFLYETIKSDMLPRLQWINKLLIKGLA